MSIYFLCIVHKLFQLLRNNYFLFRFESWNLSNTKCRALIELIFMDVMHTRASSTNKFPRKTMKFGIFLGSGTIIGIIF